MPHHRLFAFSCFTVLAGCVTDPGTSGTAYFVDAPARFEGFASKPNHRLDIYAYNKQTRQWDFIKSATSLGGAVHFGGYDLYHWDTTVLLREAPRSFCYLHERCDGTDGLARFQVREPGATPNPLVTHRPGTLDCTMGRVVSLGEDLVTAYSYCMPTNYTEVEAYYFPYCSWANAC